MQKPGFENGSSATRRCKLQLQPSQTEDIP